MTVFELLLPSRAPIASRQVSIDADYLILYDYAVISLIPVPVALPFNLIRKEKKKLLMTSKAALGALKEGLPAAGQAIEHLYGTLKRSTKFKPSAQMTVFELCCLPCSDRLETGRKKKASLGFLPLLPGDRAPIWHFKEVNEIKPSAQMTSFELFAAFPVPSPRDRSQSTRIINSI
ncbi:hypothetical protein EVAR_51197_1 [Eumeta japonica]|uniref:Uncharacterized protein n=1 Tax=Eumeta variegata TaxID=151549 RepID=A0A4C1ZB81_EUMVA|nr:hypothetical protein EVAR_51197_1 [Eumeta japonica]